MKSAKSTLTAIIAIVVIFALAILGGCGGGGGKTNAVTSPWYGDLYGVATEPADGSTGIETSRADSWIHVFWPNSKYPPPAGFTVSVEKEENPDDWGAIHTTMDTATSDAEHGSWWFQPNSDFSPNTWYRIIIRVPGVPNSAIAYFKTAPLIRAGSSLSTKSPGAATSYRPAGKSDAVGESGAEHTIRK